MNGKLVLVPTSLDPDGLLAHETIELFKKELVENNNVYFLFEEAKPARRRWLRSGLPREEIENFIYFNEHNNTDNLEQIIIFLKSGATVYLMSDCGLPAFCDPGQNLVDKCHHLKIKVTSLEFENSISLALAMSGFSHNKFYFHGFPSRDKTRKNNELENILTSKLTTILMDTPYRLTTIVNDISLLERKIKVSREYFLVMDLNCDSEQYVRGGIQYIKKSLKPKEKRNFILVVASIDP